MPARQGSRPNRSGAATRTRIIDAALQLMAEQGFAALTLQAVAARAGVLYGSVTHHYGTREGLVDAMIEGLLEQYRARFTEFARSLKASGRDPVEMLLEWLLDDAVTPETAGAFLELWAQATHSPSIAMSANRLYDEAVEACLVAFGVSADRPAAEPLREALYLLGTVVEGSSALFSTRPRDGRLYASFRRDATAILTPLIRARLADALRDEPV